MELILVVFQNLQHKEERSFMTFFKTRKQLVLYKPSFPPDLEEVETKNRMCGGGVCEGGGKQKCKKRIQMEVGISRSSHMATASFMPPRPLYPWQCL